MNLKNTPNIGQYKDLEHIVNHSFLQPWFFENVYVDSQKKTKENTNKIVGLNVSALFIDNHLLLLIDRQIHVKYKGKLERKLLEKKEKALISANKKLEKAFSKIQKTNQIYHPKNIQVPITLPRNLRVYFVCVSNIQVTSDAQSFYVKHDYPSADVMRYNDTHQLCYFSIRSFVKTIQTLQTCYDFIDFLTYYQRQSEHYFSSEADLLNEYIRSGTVFQRAKNCETILLQQNISQNTSAVLTNNDAELQHSNLMKVQEQGKFWLNVVNSYSNHVAKLDVNTVNPKEYKLYKKLLSILLLENSYSRYTLSNCITENYEQIVNKNAKNFMYYMRSYSSAKTHYAFIFIAHDEKEAQKHVLDNLPVLAEEINEQTQHPRVKNIVLVVMIENETSSSMSMTIHFLEGYKKLANTTPKK